MDKPLQDVWRVHCYGCGSLNEHGLQIKSHAQDGALVCRFRPKPFHIGHPGVVYGGTIASVIDCHAMWTAMEEYARRTGQEIAQGWWPDWGYVTANLNVTYLKPASIDKDLELHARVTDAGDRKSMVECTVSQDGVTCATAVVAAVRVSMKAKPAS